ncbi:MAG TPA: 50S ribosomal protein L13 [Petrotogaceae bacterium]|nr:50S ribosomal protein L13 [Petrotogaceae bacterium]HNY36440.1 50S ribosomal protein L13 [Petrotogaceae bacterium]HOG34313.1 50S ribosomal protein L13 [Petrotogaceae bacterium]HPO25879.1 50S ribosomal protein L13 [Petrotogaceae bacterium]HPX15077.1 50S ribosomal protein L13 [Petrotogaceae bacterium]
MASIMTQKTYMAKPAEVKRKWYLVDAQGKTLGRLASQVSKILQGKNKPTYTPHIDTGDFVIIVNAEKICVSGRKMTQKVYYRHTGFPGGLKVSKITEVFDKKPERVLEMAIKGMMPKSILSKHMIKKLKIYAGSSHPHEAQKPEKIEL